MAQVRDDLIFIIQNNPIDLENKIDTLKISFKLDSEFKLLAVGFINLYKKFISPQDMECCNFTLSCSSFGVYSIKKYGILFGMLMASDRLQRCNSLARKYYRIDPQTGLAIDFSPDHYFLFKKEKR